MQILVKIHGSWKLGIISDDDLGKSLIPVALLGQNKQPTGETKEYSSRSLYIEGYLTE